MQHPEKYPLFLSLFLKNSFIELVCTCDVLDVFYYTSVIAFNQGLKEIRPKIVICPFFENLKIEQIDLKISIIKPLGLSNLQYKSL